MTARLQKQALSLMEQCDGLLNMPGTSVQGAGANAFCVGASFCVVTAYACASVCRVAACPRSVLHVPASEGAGHWEVREGRRCMRVVCGHVC